MSTPELTHIIKVERARKHLDDLNVALNEWFNGHLLPTRLDPDPDMPGHLLLKSGVDPIPIEPFSLVLGDVVQNLRSSLDHLVFALASAYTDPLPKEIARETQFPIIGDETRRGVSGSGSAMFRDQTAQTLGAVDPKAKAAIERLQPYQNGKNFRSHPLWILNELSNIDKHRMLHVTAWSFEALVIPADAVVPPAERREGGRFQVFQVDAVEGETVFARIPRGMIVTNPEMQMRIVPAFTAVFKDDPLRGSKAMETLAKIFNYVVGDVFPKFDEFL